MESPLALVLDENPSVRERARDAMGRAGIEVVAVATPGEALDVLRAHPFAVVVTILDDSPGSARQEVLGELCRLRAEDELRAERGRLAGRSHASEEIRSRLHELAASSSPVLSTGEPGSGRRYLAERLHALAHEGGSFVVVPIGDREALDAALVQGRGTIFLAPLERLTWPAQEALAAALSGRRVRARVVASTDRDPRLAADEGRLLPALVAAFGAAMVRVPPLRERRADIAVLVRTFIEELRRLNRLPPLTVAPEALTALEGYDWPGNVRQLRSAVESAVILATDGSVRVKDLPEYVLGPAGLGDAGASARFREAKRLVVDAFERSYLEDLLKRHAGNVTGAAEHSGMLRSALQRLLRKHELHSADYRLKEPRSYAS
jgi:two-component system, NtrC family, nitrogen regulation response regulator NtrX